MVQETGGLPVPLPLRNAPTKLMKSLDYGKEYKYAHDHKNNFVDLEFLPEEISKSKFYEPSENVTEEKIRQRLKSMWGKKYGY